MFKVTLLSGIYLDSDERRANEICDALEMNIKNPVLDEIHLRVEERSDAFFEALEKRERKSAARLADLFNSGKVVVTILGRRSQYQDFFDYANNRLSGRTIVMVNADIALDETLARVGDVDFKDAFLVVSRGQYIWRPATCQDAWIFKAPVRVPGRWPFGLPGSEVKLAYEAHKAGYRVCNPSITVKVRHFHTSNKRSYKIPDDIVPGPHRDTYPSDTRPVRLSRPRGRPAVVTTADKAMNELREITRKPMLDYAHKIGASFVEIPDGPGKQMLEVFDRHDRVIYLEPSILVHPDAPDLFQIVPEGKLGVANESYQRGLKGVGQMEERYRKYGYADDALAAHAHLNPHVMVVDLWNAYLFDHPPGAYDRSLGYSFLKGGPFAGTIHRDEVYLSVACRHFNVPVFDYHPQYNYLIGAATYKVDKPFFLNPKWVRPADRGRMLKEEARKWEGASST